ncbi:MAG: hypothetical protein H6646_03310 [Anaerolineales bacterium]|nr:hypothetical protein [Anaerolineales bacterium]
MSNEPIDEKLTARLVVLLTETMKRDLDDRAHDERRPMGDLVRDLITDYLSKQVKKK